MNQSSRKRLLFVAVVIVFLLIVFFGFFFWRRWTRSQETLAAAQQARELEVAAAERACESVANPDECRGGARAELAQKSGNPDYCAPLDDETEHDRCVLMAALSAVDLDSCEQMFSSDKKIKCQETLLPAVAARQGTYEACRLIDEEKARERCQSSWILGQMMAGSCEGEAMTDELCAIGEQLRRAIEAEDPDLCALISSEDYQGTCYSMVTIGDRDHDGLDEMEEAALGTDDRKEDSDDDGLTDPREVELGTNPTLFDTDGDGYNDGIEVSTGHDPLGSG